MRHACEISLANGNGAHPARNGPGGDDRTRRRQVRRALFAGVVGTSIEWYDFFLYGTAAALVFPQLFFPESSHYAGALASFAIYAVGFAARPVGAALFGRWGDRIGRKATVIATLLLPEPNRAEVAREFEEAAQAPVPEAARASEGRVAAGVS